MTEAAVVTFSDARVRMGDELIPEES